MYKNKRILAIVPARGGSKGIKFKNIREFNGHPLVSIVGRLVSEIASIDKSIISTDDKKIKKVGEISGLSAPFLRPKDLSGDRVGDLEVLTHALLEIEAIDQVKYDVVVMLQPTSPMRTKDDVEKSIKKLINNNLDSVWTLSRSDPKTHPYKQLTLDDSGAINYYDIRGKRIIARQELSQLYYRNGVCYAMTRDCILNQKTLLGRKSSALILDGFYANIDEEIDILLGEFYLSKIKI